MQTGPDQLGPVIQHQNYPKLFPYVRLFNDCKMIIFGAELKEL